MDRDLFRPGDPANLVTVVRGPQVTVPPEFPVRLEIRQPDGPESSGNCWATQGTRDL